MLDSVQSAWVRSQLYGMLGSGFGDPRNDLAYGPVPQKSAEEFAVSLKNLYGSEELRDAWRRQQSAREALRDTKTREQLRDTYCDLFVNLHPGAGVPPYETEYTSGVNDFLKNQDLADLMGFYRAFGLDLGQGERLSERPDHIAVELEFMHFLCWKEALARTENIAAHIEICQDAERKFLGDHLGRWADRFAERVEGSTPVEFFLAITSLLRLAVKQEAALMELTLEPIQCLPVLPGNPGHEMACELGFGCPFGK